MSVNVSDWKLSRDSVAIAQVLTFLPSLDQTKVVSKALDGTVYIQTIGDPIKHAAVTILATREEMAPVNQAEADGAVLSAVYRETRYAGYIEAAPEWQPVIPGEWYTADIKFLIQEETAV